tara:strand:- start:632 stop:850 length:219 start_codon:yes stop_codon:yes gene_type:complete
MIEQETLFDLSPEVNTEKIEQTEIEYMQFSFSDFQKKELIFYLEKIINTTDMENYSELLFRLVKDEYDKIKS